MEEENRVLADAAAPLKGYLSLSKEDPFFVLN